MHDMLYYGFTYSKSQIGFVNYLNVDQSSMIDRQQSIGEWLFIMESISIFGNNKHQASVHQSSYEFKYYALSKIRKQRV